MMPWVSRFLWRPRPCLPAPNSRRANCLLSRAQPRPQRPGAFHANPNSRGQFRVTDLTGPKDVVGAKNLTTEFTVEGTAPANPLAITVTDEQVRLLRGQKP